MQVVVKVHESARPEYEAWRARLEAPPLGGEELARIHIRELFAELERTLGTPHGVDVNRSVHPAECEWRYTADTLIRYQLRDTPARLFRPAVRTVVITAIRPVPPR